MATETATIRAIRYNVIYAQRSKAECDWHTKAAKSAETEQQHTTALFHLAQATDGELRYQGQIMQALKLLLPLLLVACAQMHPMPMSDAGVPLGDAGGRLQSYGQNGLCPVAIDRNAELNCPVDGPNVNACPAQWDGAETCDADVAPTCIDQLAGATDCFELQIVWRRCLSACTPTPP